MPLHIVSPVSFVPTRHVLESFWSSLFQLSRRKIKNLQICCLKRSSPMNLSNLGMTFFGQMDFPSLATVVFLLIVGLHAGVPMPSNL